MKKELRSAYNFYQYICKEMPSETLRFNMAYLNDKIRILKKYAHENKI